MFCALSKALQSQLANGVKTPIIDSGCEFFIEKVSDPVVEISMRWRNDVSKSMKDIEKWLTFVNSAEGMMWVTHKLTYGVDPHQLEK